MNKTQDSILKFLYGKQDWLSTADIASGIRTEHATSRVHLDKLMRNGYVKRLKVTGTDIFWRLEK